MTQTTRDVRYCAASVRTFPQCNANLECKSGEKDAEIIHDRQAGRSIFNARLLCSPTTLYIVRHRWFNVSRSVASRFIFHKRIALPANLGIACAMRIARRFSIVRKPSPREILRYLAKINVELSNRPIDEIHRADDVNSRRPVSDRRRSNAAARSTGLKRRFLNQGS